jgi:hypothetical protein
MAGKKVEAPMVPDPRFFRVGEKKAWHVDHTTVFSETPGEKGRMVDRAASLPTRP